MACKVPILESTNYRIYIPNVIGDLDLIFKQKNINDLKYEFERLMLNEDFRKSFGLSGFNPFKNNFYYEIISDKTYKLRNILLKHKAS